MSETDLSAWIGRRETQTDWIAPSRVAAWRATLGLPVSTPDDGEAVPPAVYWTLFPPLAPTPLLSADGHARRGDFLPPVTLPRRMWAGSRLTYHAPLRAGARLERESVVHRIESKQGQHGALIFVTVRHTVRDPDADILTEEQDLVYRAPAAAQATTAHRASPPSQPPARWTRTVLPHEALLFRYSAITFNAHRIHYDRPYAESEGYPGLVVHGPLIATLLLGLVESELPDASLERFDFTAKRPAFDGVPLTLCGAPSPDNRRIDLWSLTNDGAIGVEASAWIR